MTPRRDPYTHAIDRQRPKAFNAYPVTLCARAVSMNPNILPRVDSHLIVLRNPTCPRCAQAQAGTHEDL
jgi:hypothetical protein